MNAEKLLKKIVKSGCRDIKGALADALYSDVAMLTDLIGDYTYSLVENPLERKAVYLHVAGKGTDALSKAARRLSRNIKGRPAKMDEKELSRLEGKIAGFAQDACGDMAESVISMSGLRI